MKRDRGLARSLAPFALVIVVIAVAYAARPYVWSSGDDSAAQVEATLTNAPTRTPPPSQSAVPTKTGGTATPAAEPRDLKSDEARGGHTIARHVGKSDAELRSRLQREPDISAASTFTDLRTAEEAVGAAIAAGGGRIAAWVSRGSGRSNLALEYESAEVVGRSLRRGQSQPSPASTVVVVLRAAGSSWYVLTSYPEAN